MVVLCVGSWSIGEGFLSVLPPWVFQPWYMMVLVVDLDVQMIPCVKSLFDGKSWRCVVEVNDSASKDYPWVLVVKLELLVKWEFTTMWKRLMLDT